MKINITSRLAAVSLAVFIQATWLGNVSAQLTPRDAGNLLLASAASEPASPKPLQTPPAVTLPEAVSTSPVSTESFSTIQCAPAEEPALILPVTPIFGPGQIGFMASAPEKRDLLGSISEECQVAPRHGKPWGWA
jgi:hypothetical protein